MEEIFSLEKIDQIAQKILPLLTRYRVLALHGEMGAGKTTLIHALCKIMGVQEHTSSPTFSIINEYAAIDGTIIYHIDLYRLKNVDEAISSGVEDCLYSGNTCMVEWPERAPQIFPDDTLHLHISALTTNTRKLTIQMV